MAIKTVRTRLFLTREDVPANLPKQDKIIIYDELDNEKKRSVKFTTLRNTNFNDISKLNLAIKMVDLFNDVDELKRELVNSRVRERFWKKKLVEAGFSASFTPDEINEFKVTLDAVLIENVDRMLDGKIPVNVREHIANKVGECLAEAEAEYGKDEDFNIIRLSNQNTLLDIEIDKIHRCQSSIEKRSRALKTCIELQHKNSDRLSALNKKSKPNVENKKNNKLNVDNFNDIDFGYIDKPVD